MANHHRFLTITYTTRSSSRLHPVLDLHPPSSPLLLLQIGGQWLIVDHHSSGMPEKVEKKIEDAKKADSAKELITVM